LAAYLPRRSLRAFEKSTSGIARSERFDGSVTLGIGSPFRLGSAPRADNANDTAGQAFREDEEQDAPQLRLADEPEMAWMRRVFEGDSKLVEEYGHRLLERDAVLA
jgi:hypothetical protein